MRLLNRYYNWAGNADVIGLVLRKKINIHWVIEAGCHDGQDTLKLAKSLQPERIVAFEPDTKIRNRAEALFKQNQLKVELFDVALSDVNSIQYMNFMNGIEGSGSTYISQTGSVPVQVETLDSIELNLNGKGLLWLDVEGHAVQALVGGLNTLRNLSVAKVEVQMHEMHEARKSDLFEVIRILKFVGLAPIKAPLHPGYFGDLLFVRYSELGIGLKFWSFVLQCQLVFLHKYLYPLLRKPSRSMHTEDV